MCWESNLLKKFFLKINLQYPPNNFREKYFHGLDNICKTYGIKMGLPEQVNPIQSVIDIPSSEIVSMSHNQYKQLQLCCVALMYQLIQMNNEKYSENEMQGKGLTNSGFSNAIMLILVLLIFTLIIIIILLMMK